MNTRKNIDYSAMFADLDAAVTADFSQVQLYCELGRIVCGRSEKGAAVAAAKYLSEQYPNVPGFSPRNLRRMRDFYRMYGENEELLKLAAEISWTQNVVILEADLNMEERCWYLLAAKQYGWSKSALQNAIQECAHQELTLDEFEVPCYTDHEENQLESSENDQDTFSLSRQYLQKPDGRVCDERYGEESWSGTGVPDRISSYQHRGNRKSCLPTCPPEIGRAWNRLFRQNSMAAPEQRLRQVRPADRHGSRQYPEYVPDLWWRLCRQNAPSDGFYKPTRRGSRPVVHRRLRCDLAGCYGRLSGSA